MQHSGSLRLYADRLTLRYDALDPLWLDRVVAYLQSIGRRPYYVLDGAEVDYVETLEGSGFKFSNPQVKSTCGCGSSFQV